MFLDGTITCLHSWRATASTFRWLYICLPAHCEGHCLELVVIGGLRCWHEYTALSPPHPSPTAIQKLELSQHGFTRSVLSFLYYLTYRESQSHTSHYHSPTTRIFLNIVNPPCFYLSAYNLQDWTIQLLHQTRPLLD